MLKVEKTEDKCRVELSGDLFDIVEDTMYLLSTIYGALKRNYPNGAPMYRKLIQSAVVRKNSPVWRERKPSEEVYVRFPKDWKERMHGERDNGEQATNG